MPTGSDLTSVPTDNGSQLDTRCPADDEASAGTEGLSVNRVDDLIGALYLMSEDQLSRQRWKDLQPSIRKHLIKPLWDAFNNACAKKEEHVPWSTIAGIFSDARTAKANGKFIFSAAMAKRVLYSQEVPEGSQDWHGCQQYMSLITGALVETRGDIDITLTPQDRDMLYFGFWASVGSKLGQ